MKNLLILGLLLLSSIQAYADLSGVVVLNGKEHEVNITTPSKTNLSGALQVGNIKFKLLSYGKDFTGEYKLIENETIVKHNTVHILGQLIAEKELRELVKNKAEINCNSESNSVILLADELKNSLIGNCLVLK